MDAVCYITKIMDDQAVFFDPSDEVNEEPEEDDYDTLMNEGEMTSAQMGHFI
jgi:hypothetical protein